ncbi:MAG TPA: glycosyltransferase [Pyrinomonadaceae bacterium]|jgi:glycosyltransferase involved in cell wall biosynthesis
MKNVLQFIGSFHQGGSERQAVQLTRLLNEDQTYNIYVATLNKEGVLLGEIENLDLPEIPEFKLKSFYDANFFLQLKKCVRFMRENKIEIVHTHDFYTNVFGITAARLAGVECKIASKRETAAVRSKAQKVVEKRIFKTADRIVANSEAVKKYLINENVPADKISVIYNGLDAKRLTPKETNRTKIRAELSLPVDENTKFITLVANLRHEVKNQPMFLRVAQKVLRNFPETHFVLAGEGELKAGLENTAKDLQIEKHTHFIGRCAQVPELLLISYAGVLTSYAEGFSNSILEYMAAGKPVVATNVGGAAEAIIENETGFLIESGDDETMANRLIELLENAEKTERFGEKAKAIVKEKFSLESQLNKTLELYSICEYDK